MFHTIRNIFSYFKEKDNFNKFSFNYFDAKQLLEKQLNIPYKKKRLLAIYDFIDMPYTFDISNFMLKAEIERRRNNLDKIDVVLVTNDTYPLNTRFQDGIDVSNYKTIIHNIFIEFLRLCNTTGSLFIIDNRNQAIDFINNMRSNYILYPFDYDVNNPFERVIDYKDRALSFYLTDYYKYAKQDASINYIRPPKDQVELVRKWLLKNVYPKIPIVITLRETKAVSSRNSNIEQWQKLVSFYEKQNDNYKFIVIRDFYALYSEDNIVGKNVVYCNEAGLSVSFRASLYQESSLSLFVANGAGMLAWYNQKVNYLMFGIGTQHTACSSVKSNKDKLNIELNDDWHGATKFQKLIWRDDTVDVICDELDKMIRLLENENKLYPRFYDKDFTDEVEVVKIKDEVYKNDSAMSQRIPLKYYLYIFKLLGLIRKNYLSIEDKNLKVDDKIIFYGAGTITKDLIKKYHKNTIGIVDKNYHTIKTKKLDSIDIYPLDGLKTLKYDYIVITPKFREYEIINELKSQFNISKNSFLIASKYK